VTPDGRIDPQPVTLDVVPVTMVEDATRREALAAANGRDLVQERVSQVVRFLGVVVLLLAIVRCLVGCAALERAVPGVAVARDVAKVCEERRLELLALAQLLDCDCVPHKMLEAVKALQVAASAEGNDCIRVRLPRNGETQISIDGETWYEQKTGRKV